MDAEAVSCLNKFVDLGDTIDATRSAVLNAANPDALSLVLQGAAEGANVLRSDCDEQLLFTVAFKQPIRLHSVAIMGPAASAPKSVKLFANKPDFGFDDVEDAPATQEFTLGAAEAAGRAVLPHFVKFQSVTSLTLFVLDNQSDGDVSCVSRLSFVGQAVPKTNMDDFKRGG
mmetsp:Transcript_29275/g.50083  ORF Transcript_29275/g.50083 Transcript_29275/m.50083 type:complete len:172 (-) Transcript_29275:259-774(-)